MSDNKMITENENETETENNNANLNLPEIYQHAKRIIESLLFSSSDPITPRRMNDVLQDFHPLTNEETQKLIEELAADYDTQNRAFQIAGVGKGYILRTREEYGLYIHKLLKTARPERLSHAGAEVLAIIAYKQPISRPQIDEIRGVDSSGIVHTLLEKQLIETAGKLDVPGRPMLYTVSQNFLKHFGINSLQDLPHFGIR